MIGEKSGRQEFKKILEGPFAAAASELVKDGSSLVVVFHGTNIQTPDEALPRVVSSVISARDHGAHDPDSQMSFGLHRVDSVDSESLQQAVRDARGRLGVDAPESLRVVENLVGSVTRERGRATVGAHDLRSGSERRVEVALKNASGLSLDNGNGRRSVGGLFRSSFGVSR